MLLVNLSKDSPPYPRLGAADRGQYRQAAGAMVAFIGAERLSRRAARQARTGQLRHLSHVSVVEVTADGEPMRERLCRSAAHIKPRSRCRMILERPVSKYVSVCVPDNTHDYEDNHRRNYHRAEYPRGRRYRITSAQP